MKRIAFITFISSILIFPFQIKAQAVENVFLKANEGHTDIINDFILSANNKYLVSCGEDKTIILWDFDTAKEIKRINGHKNNISCIDINFDNTQIATGEGGKEIDTKYVVKIWDIKTSKELRTIKPNAGKILSVKFLNKGKSLLVAGSSRIIYYDLETSSKARDFLDIKEELLNVSISKDQRIISAQSKNKIYIWDIEQRELVKIIEPNSGEFTSIFLDSNGNNAITGSNNNTLTIFNTLSGKEHKNIVAFRYPILTVAADDKNQFIVASDSKSKFFKIFDYNTGDEIRSIEAHAGRVGLIKISLSNQFIITAGSWDRTIKLWDINTGEFVKEFRGIKKSIYEHAYMYSSNYCAIGKIRNRAFINYMSKQNKNQVFKDKYGEVSCITLSNNKQLLAFGTSKNKTKIYDIALQKEIFSFDTQKSWIREIAFSYDNKQLATASFEQIKIWDVNTGKEIISIDNAFKVPYYINFSKDNKFLAVGCRKSAKVFEIASGKLIHSFKIKTIVYSLDFSNNGKYLVTGEGFKTERDKYKIIVWDLETGQTTKIFDGHNRQITTVKFSHGDSLIVSSGNKLIKVWHLEKNKKIREIEAHARWINDIELSKDNKQLISTSQDGTIKIWDLNTGALLLTEIGLKDSDNWISYTPDGRFNGTDKGIKSLYFVKKLEIVPLENVYEKFYTPQLTADISLNKLDTNLTLSKLKGLPEITITKPNNTSPVFRGDVKTVLSTNKKLVEVSTIITNTDGELNEVRVYQNNKLIISDKLDSIKLGQDIEKNYQLSLAKGLNIIEVACYNTDRTKKSKRIGIEYTGDKFNPANLYVFAIGINNYKKPSYNLNYAVADATAFVKELTKDSNKIFNHIETISLINENATNDSILACFNSIKEKAEQNDVFVFYYAGHGSMSSDEGENKSEFFLIPWEITNLYSNPMLQKKGISARKLQEFSKEIKAQKQLFILDACHSGGAVEYLASRGSEKEQAIAQLAHSTGTYFITASGSQQLAGEFGTLGHGVFTYAVLEALKGDASTKDNKLTVKELALFVEEQVPVLSKKYKGNAQYPTSYGFGQDFPILMIKK